MLKTRHTELVIALFRCQFSDQNIGLVSFYHQISAVVHTPTVFQDNTLDTIENEAVITLASFKTARKTTKRGNKTGTCPTTGVGTQLIVTVWRAGSS